MFAVHLRRVYHTCDKIIIRNLRGKNYTPRGSNPGLDNRIRAFEEDGFRVKEDNVEEFVEQSDSDFYKAGEVYNEHLNETLMGKYEVQHRIIKEKYFKENMPNLLTWSEKEQIRHLAEEQPDEWTLERIAESFPVTVPVVKKLLKYNWKPATKERIARHDASVMRNWRELKEGSLDIPDKLREHFLKFSDRTIPPLNKKSIKIDLTQEEKLGEFEKIVQRCATSQEKSKNVNGEKTNIEFGTEGSEKIIKQKLWRDPKLVTLDELTEKIKKRAEEGKKVYLPDKIMVDTVNSEVNSTQNNNTQIELNNENGDENRLVTFKDEDEEKEEMPYPERIRIPKKAYKKDATYKVNDCYYDHDGRFLYRVLGMSNSKVVK